MIYTNNTAKEVIKASQITAKWQCDSDRRQLAAFAYDMYNGLYQEYLNEKIDQDVDSQGDESELKTCIDSADMLANITKDISLVFAEPFEVSVVDKSGEVKDDQTAALNEILKKANKDVVATEINRLTNLFFDMTAIPVTRNGKIEIDLITPNRSFITGNMYDQTNADKFYYQIGEMPNDQKNNSRSDIYMECDTEGKRLVIISGAEGKERKILPYTDAEYADFEDTTKYPFNPATTFRNYLNISSYWHTGLNPLVSKSLTHDQRLTEYNLAKVYQQPLLVSYGLSDDQKITIGHKSRVNVPPNAMQGKQDVQYVTPDQKLLDLMKTLETDSKETKLAHHMSESMVTGTTATSGYQLWLQKAELLHWNQSQRKYYTEPLRQLCLNIMALSNQYKGLGGSFSEGLDVQIQYGDQKFIETPDERIKRQAQEMMSGTRNLVDIEIENSGGTLEREDALKIVMDRVKEKRDISALNAPAFEVASTEE